MKNAYVHVEKVYNNRHKSDHILGPTIESALLVVDDELLSELMNGNIQKMKFVIIHQHPWITKSSDHILKN
jgi:hypothetical protein